MPLPPKPFKYVCKNCGFKRIVRIRSDALSPLDLLKLNSTCPKCGKEMDREELSFWDKLFLKD